MKPGLLPSAERLAAAGLVVAGLAIAALAFLVVSDLARESELHREVIAVQHARDGLEALRVQINDMLAAARLGAATGDANAFARVERRAGEIQERLDALDEDPDALDARAEDVVPQARLLVVHARSVAPARARGGAEGAAAAVREADRVASEAAEAIQQSLGRLAARVSDRSLARIRVGERLRTYVAWFVAASLLVLGGLFVAFRGAQARERAALRRAEWLAHFDSVTRLPNRALLADRLAQEVARARREEEAFAVLLFDLDGFKEVNDTWGHAAGDQVLGLVGERARKCVRASDTVGRLGGDEFLAILPGAGAEGALAVAEKLRLLVREPYVVGDVVARIGVSIGISLFPAHGEDPEALQRSADAALYEAKREGKDRSRLARGATARRPAAQGAAI